MSRITSKITSLAIVYKTVYSGTDERKYQSSASLAFVRGIHRSPVNSPNKWPVTRKMFPFDDVIMQFHAWNKDMVGFLQFGLFQWYFIAFMLLSKVLRLRKCNVMRLNYNFKCQRKINCNISAVLRIISECLCVSKMPNPLYYTELVILCTNHKELLCNWH